MHARFGGGKSKKYQSRQLVGFLSYKVHLTETCDEETPHLLINVETTAATTQDIEETELIHHALAQKQLLPLSTPWIPDMWMAPIWSAAQSTTASNCWVPSLLIRVGKGEQGKALA